VNWQLKPKVIRVLSESPSGNILGFEVNPRTLREKRCRIEDGVVYEQQEFIHHRAIKSKTAYYDALKYGGLTQIPTDEQKAKLAKDQKVTQCG